jgi:hypothetical protein
MTNAEDQHTKYNTGVTLAHRFHILFRGCERAHGFYGAITPDRARADGKFVGKPVTKREPVTDELWEAHLKGEYGLGIIPIRDDGTTSWGAIDIDVYEGLDHGGLASQIAKQELPLIPCRSKSGGAHLLLFCTEPVPGKTMQDRLKDIAASIGYATAEIYPKQCTMGGDRDLGSWINACYFDHDKTNRYAVLANGDALNAEEFLVLAESIKQSPAWFAKPLQRPPDPLPDGPPCLNHLMALGFPPGTWNPGMFNLGVYCRKAHPDNWKEHLVELNARTFPIDKWPVSDLDGIKKSLSKKDYRYQCDKPPLLQHCERAACKRRKYGVSGANSLPDLHSLSKLCTDPPIWFLELDGHRLEFSTAQLLNPLAFQEVCANASVIVPVVGRAAWTEHLRPFVARANEIPVSEDGAGDDFSATGHFLELLERFLSGRAQGDSMEDVLFGKYYTTGGRTYFRTFALQTYLARMGFRDLKRNELVSVLRAHGGINRQDRIGGKPTRVWSIPEFYRGDDKPLDLPPGLADEKTF